jgi:hypothetical protein
MKRHWLAIALFFLVFSSLVQSKSFAQSDDSIRAAAAAAEAERANMSMSATINMSAAASRAREFALTYAGFRGFWSENELTKKEKLLLAVEVEELKKHEAFLKQPKTALCKLLNFKPEVVDAKELKAQPVYPPLRGAGTYYSFVKQSHAADEWAQLRIYKGAFLPGYSVFKHGEEPTGPNIRSFVITSGYALTVFTPLGNVPLDHVTSEHPAITLLSQYKPPTQMSEFARETQKFLQGIQVSGATFSTGVLAQVNQTYGIRSVLYKKADVVIVFRVVREEADGSLYLMWKEVRSFAAPKLEGKAK